MGNQLKWLTLWCFGITLGVASQAAETKGLAWTGSAEGGFRHAWRSSDSNNGVASGNHTGFLVDSAKLNLTATVSDHTKVIMNNAFAVNGRGSNTLSGGFSNDSSAYFSELGYTTGGGMGFAHSVNALYLDHKCMDGLHTSVGFFGNPFGMETMWDRYNMHTFFYTRTTTVANSYGWWYDLGVKLTLSDVIPGALEFAVVDDKNSEEYSPAAAIRYNMEIKNGDVSITPVLSAYLGRMSGGPRDLGFSAGGMLKMGALFTNLEFLYVSRNAGGEGDNKTTDWGVWVEPGFDAGVANFSVKAEMANNKPTGGSGNTDFNVGAAVSKTFEGNLRVKFAYLHSGLANKISVGAGSHINEARLQIGTSW